MLKRAHCTVQAASQPKYAIGLYCSTDSVLYIIKEVQLHINDRSSSEMTLLFYSTLLLTIKWHTIL